MKTIFILLAEILMLLPVFGQVNKPVVDDYSDLVQHKNTIYIEALGNGGYGSLNVERMFFKKPQCTLSVRAGVSLTWEEGKTQVVFPLETTLLLGLRNCFETGPGITFSPRGKGYIFFYRIGYRLRTANRIILRIAPMLMISPDVYTGPFAGASLGYAF